MGNKSSKISNWHFLHYTKFNENKLYLFDCESERFYICPLFLEAFPFFPGNINTISIETRGVIYFIGGLGFKDIPFFNFESDLVIEEDENSEEDDFYKEKKNKLQKYKDKKYMYFAKTDKLINELDPLNIICSVSLDNLNSDRFFIEQENYDQLPKNRTSHCLVFNEPYIYIIGGIEDNVPTKECYKFNIKTKLLENMAEISLTNFLDNSTGIVINDNIYVFDSKSKVQCIHKYLIEYDLWEIVAYKSENFKIPHTINPTIYQYDEEKLIYLNGNNENADEFIDYYIFNIEKEAFTLLRTDRKIGYLSKDKQGSKDYIDCFKIYGNMNDKEIKVLDKINFVWNSITINNFNSLENNNKRGCGG